MKKPYLIRDWLKNYYLTSEEELGFANRTLRPIALYLEAMKGKTIQSLTIDEVRASLPRELEKIMLYDCETDDERMVNLRYL